MNILGISAHYHDSAAALLVDGFPACAVQEERLSRRKNDASFPLAAIEWCLEHADLDPDDLDAVVFYERSMLKFDRILTTALRAFPKSWRSFPHAMKNSLGEKIWVRGIIASQLGIPRKKVLSVDHHASHAAAAFLTAPTRRSAILTADGVGEWATLTTGQGEHGTGRGGTRIRLTREIRFPHSLGLLYSAFTAYLGFAVNEDEYKVMGLAAYGRPTMVDRVSRLIRRTPDGAFALVPEYFEYQTTASRSYSQQFVDLFGPPRSQFEPIDFETDDGQRFADCAASVQLVLEDVLVDIARALHRETGLPDLCLGGGVALNGVANARLLAESGFDRVFVPCAPGDAGCALGAALYADRIYYGNAGRDVPDHPYWGPAVGEADLARAAREDGCTVEEAGASIVERIADELAEDRIVGWMDGACEFGPRALGHRSILAGPHSRAIRDRLNREIKRREDFRPFAPVVPAEAAGRYFELPPGGARLGRFMSGVFLVRPEWRERLAGVTHVDGSARVQVLDRDMEPRLYALLEAYGRRSGVPILLNTSFNVAGEPIVARGLEGYSAFRRCGIDVLAAGSTLVMKRGTPPAAARAMEAASWP